MCHLQYIDNDLESIASLIASNQTNSVAMLLNSNINSKLLNNLIINLFTNFGIQAKFINKKHTANDELC